MSKNVLVTGAAGFLGSHICNFLLKKGYCVTGIDNFFRGKKENLPKHKDFCFYELDLATESERLDKIFLEEDFHWVIHYAAINGTKYFYDIPTKVFNDNCNITMNVLNACKLSKTIEKFAYASSSEVYGNNPDIPTKEEKNISLNVFEDRDSYAAAKAFGDFMTKLYCKEMKIPYLVFRIFNAYGPRMDNTEYGQVIPEFFRKATEAGNFKIIGDGEQTRSFCFVEDHVKMIYSSMLSSDDKVINIGNDEIIKMIDLARKICEINNKDFTPEHLPPRSYDTIQRQPDLTEVRKVFKDEMIDLDTGLLKMHQYIIEGKNGT